MPRPKEDPLKTAIRAMIKEELCRPVNTFFETQSTSVSRKKRRYRRRKNLTQVK